jgi:uncharacterized membrane protein
MQQLLAVIWLVAQVCMVITVILLISRTLASRFTGLEEMEARASAKTRVDWVAYRAWHDRHLRYAMTAGLFSAISFAAVMVFVYFTTDHYPEAKRDAGHMLIANCFFSFLFWLNPWSKSQHF